MDNEETTPDYPISEDFDRDSISWVTDDVAITSVNGAEEALLEEGYFVINVAEEILNDAHARMPVGFSSWDLDRQRQTVDLIAGVIEGVLHYTDHKVVVHCQQGMERSVLAVACWLRKHKEMSLDEAYRLIRRARPIALDCREWIGEAPPDDPVFK